MTFLAVVTNNTTDTSVKCANPIELLLNLAICHFLNNAIHNKSECHYHVCTLGINMLRSTKYVLLCSNRIDIWSCLNTLNYYKFYCVLLFVTFSKMRFIIEAEVVFCPFSWYNYASISN